MSGFSTTSAVNLSSRSCVVFDYDGTLGDTLPSIVRTAREVLLGFGMAEEELGDLSRLVGPPFPEAYSLVYGLSPEDAAEVTRRYRAIYGSLGPSAWPTFPHMHEFLEDLRAAGKTLAVASSKRTALLRRCIADGGIAEFFTVIQGKEHDGTASKAQTIEYVISELGFSPDESVMVGDRHYDVDAAREVGVPCAGVYFGHTAAAGELEQAGAAAIAHSLEELRACLLAS
jgi:phosphoglycolate phosphatase